MQVKLIQAQQPQLLQRHNLNQNKRQVAFGATDWNKFLESLNPKAKDVFLEELSEAATIGPLNEAILQMNHKGKKLLEGLKSLYTVDAGQKLARITDRLNGELKSLGCAFVNLKPKYQYSHEVKFENNIESIPGAIHLTVNEEKDGTRSLTITRDGKNLYHDLVKAELDDGGAPVFILSGENESSKQISNDTRNRLDPKKLAEYQKRILRIKENYINYLLRLKEKSNKEVEAEKKSDILFRNNLKAYVNNHPEEVGKYIELTTEIEKILRDANIYLPDMNCSKPRVIKKRK